MWHQTFAGLISGLLFLLLIPTAFSLFFPTFTAFMIMMAIVVFIPTWAGIMTYCYAATSVKQAWLRALTFSLISGLFYFCAYFTVGVPQ